MRSEFGNYLCGHRHSFLSKHSFQVLLPVSLTLVNHLDVFAYQLRQIIIVTFILLWLQVFALVSYLASFFKRLERGRVITNKMAHGSQNIEKFLAPSFIGFVSQQLLSNGNRLLSGLVGFNRCTRVVTDDAIKVVPEISVRTTEGLVNFFRHNQFG